jgi:hypothetical protein
MFNMAAPVEVAATRTPACWRSHFPVVLVPFWRLPVGPPCAPIGFLNKAQDQHYRGYPPEIGRLMQRQQHVHAAQPSAERCLPPKLLFELCGMDVQTCGDLVLTCPVSGKRDRCPVLKTKRGRRLSTHVIQNRRLKIRKKVECRFSSCARSRPAVLCHVLRPPSPMDKLEFDFSISTKNFSACGRTRSRGGARARLLTPLCPCLPVAGLSGLNGKARHASGCESASRAARRAFCKTIIGADHQAGKRLPDMRRLEQPPRTKSL